MYDLFPKWLNRFSFKIEDEYETMLLSEEETNPQNVRFIDSLGITTGAKLLIHDVEYVVKDFALYSEMNNFEDNVDKQDGFGFDLHIIVEEA
ncbi:MAG: hypothetical protein ACP5DQ_12275 [Bacteroidales bacterium]